MCWMGCDTELEFSSEFSVENLFFQVEDMLRSVTSIKIKEARMGELKQEIVNSEKLKVKKIFSKISKNFPEPF